MQQPQGQTSNVSQPDRAIFPGVPAVPPDDVRAYGNGQTAGIEQTFSGSLTAIPSQNLGVSGAFYVPVYSSVAMSQGKLRADFSVRLSIHNASETQPLVLRRIAYFDTSGNMVENHLKAPVALKPYSTIEVF